MLHNPHNYGLRGCQRAISSKALLPAKFTRLEAAHNVIRGISGRAGRKSSGIFTLSAGFGNNSAF